MFEFMPDGSLHSMLYHRFIKKLGPPSDDFIRRTIHQVLQALEHLHNKGWMHRDVKPGKEHEVVAKSVEPKNQSRNHLIFVFPVSQDNLLLKGDLCKLADFSLARPCSRFHESDGGGGPMTQSVATLWYRAPEIVLLAHDYSSPVDIFGLGCVAAEMFRLKPLFPSRNDADMLCRLLKMLGNPIASGWNQGQVLLEKRGPYLEIDTRDFAKADFRTNLSEWLGSGSVKRNPGPLLDLLIGMLYMHPTKRFTASQALQNPFFYHNSINNTGRSSIMVPTGQDDLDLESSVVTTSPRVEEEVIGHCTSHLERTLSITNAPFQHPQKLVLKRCK